MKTSEFKRAMGNLGYMNVTNNKNDIQVYSYRNMGRGNGEIIWVSGRDRADFRFYYDGQNLNDEALKQASKTAIEYAFTPIDEREDVPKKYAIHLFSGDKGYLNYGKRHGYLTNDNTDTWSGNYQCLFTEQEYNETTVFVPADPLEAEK